MGSMYLGTSSARSSALARDVTHWREGRWVCSAHDGFALKRAGQRHYRPSANKRQLTGLMMTALPAAMALRYGTSSSWKGKFHVPMIRLRPRGSGCVYCLLLEETVGAGSGPRRWLAFSLSGEEALTLRRAHTPGERQDVKADGLGRHPLLEVLDGLLRTRGGEIGVGKG